MADNRGRSRGRGGYSGDGQGPRGGGRGGYSGRGDGQGYRGGRGDGQGYRGGRGDDQGYRGGRGDGQGYRGGRGDGQGYRGGRGDGQGYRGGRGDGQGYRGGRGDGQGYRGGRGGPRGGGRGGYQGPDCFGQGSAIPAPDATVTQLEDRWVKENSAKTSDLTSQMKKLSVQDPSSALVNAFPKRPGFGNKGTEIILWANYFRLDMKEISILKYALEVTKVLAEDDRKSKNQDPIKATGKKLVAVIGVALAQLPPTVVVASEFKAQVITPHTLSLPSGGVMEVELPDPGRRRIEKWEVRFSGPIHMDTGSLLQYLKTLQDSATDESFPRFPDEISAIGVVLSHTARTNSNITAVGASRFFASDSQRVEEVDEYKMSTPFLSILRGYFQSVRLATGRLLMNANVTHGVFRRPIPLGTLFAKLGVHQMSKLARGEVLSDQEQRKLDQAHRFLSKARVRCKIFDESNHKAAPIHAEFTMHGLCTRHDGQVRKKADDAQKQRLPPKFMYDKQRFGSPSQVMFYLKSPTDPTKKLPALAGKYDKYITVAEFQKLKYGQVVSPDLPLVNVGSAAVPLYVPAEHCEVKPGQAFKGRLSPTEQDAMIQFACRPPPQNATSITTSARDLLALDNNSLLRSFGISVGQQLVTVKGRELVPPMLQYAANRTVQPADGSWLMKGVKVVKAGRPIKGWTYLQITTRGQRTSVAEPLRKFTTFLTTNMGIGVQPKEPSPAEGVHVNLEYGGASENNERLRQEQQLRDGMAKISKNKTEFVVVVLPEKSTAIYNMVKKVVDVEFGFQSVCMVQAKLFEEKGQFGYWANVALKVNIKFGGLNHAINQGGRAKTMLVGYDVIHPTNLSSAAASSVPSIVALVATTDQELAHYPGVYWHNPARTESVGVEMVEHFKTRLALYRSKNGDFPADIIIFRDGVSEGQYKMVLEGELPHIRQACQQVYPKDRAPRIAVIVAVKRHHTRFYPTDKDHIHSRSKSPKEGTVVDRGITNARYWNFYLQAHASLQGTARPAHYVVLLDEIFRQDHGQEAANKLEQLVHNMCYLYNRATKAVSICPPVYYADLLCTRARIHQNELFDDASTVSSGQQANVAMRQVHDRIKDTMYYV